MKCDELKPVFVDMSGNIVANELGELYYKPEVDAAIEELKKKLENVQASMYADVVDAGMEVRRLKRALYKAYAMWADRTRLICSVFGSNAPKIRWERMLDKCRAKAEEYK